MASGLTQPLDAQSLKLNSAESSKPEAQSWKPEQVGGSFEIFGHNLICKKNEANISSSVCLCCSLLSMCDANVEIVCGSRCKKHFKLSETKTIFKAVASQSSLLNLMFAQNLLFAHTSVKFMSAPLLTYLHILAIERMIDERRMTKIKSLLAKADVRPSDEENNTFEKQLCSQVRWAL